MRYLLAALVAILLGVSISLSLPTTAVEVSIPRTATLVVAASDASEASKAQADYICDGRNDYATIMSAIDVLPASKGKVQLSEGTFTLGLQPITLPQIGDHEPAGFILEGMGEGATIINASADGAIVYDLDTATSHITLQGFTIRAYYSKNPAVYLRNVYYSNLKDITIRGTGGATDSVRPDGIVFEDCNTINVFNLRSIINQRWGVYLGGPGRYCNAIHFYGCVFQWNGNGGNGGGVNIYRGTGNTLTDCVIEGNTGIGVNFVEITQANKVVGTYFEANSFADVVMQGEPVLNIIASCYSNGGGGDYFVVIDSGYKIVIRECLEVNHAVASVKISSVAKHTVLDNNDFESPMIQGQASSPF